MELWIISDNEINVHNILFAKEEFKIKKKKEKEYQGSIMLFLLKLLRLENIVIIIR